MGSRARVREDGQGLVEFAIILPVLLLLLLGMIEFGLILYNQHVITNASREGARYGIVVHNPRREPDSIAGVVNEYCANNLVTFGSSPPLEITIDPAITSGALFGQDLSVDVSFHYDFLVLPNFLGDLFGGFDLRAHTTMKYE
jgi:hypothetical protein